MGNNAGMGEFELIALIRDAIADAGRGVVVGIGDDGALLEMPPDHLLVAATDTLNEGVHFSTDADPYDLGYKSLAVNLSDLAAMGAEPAWSLLNLSLPTADERWLGEFARGFSALAGAHGVTLAGGDTCRGPLSITVTALGWVRAEKALRRSGASGGDLIVLTGTVGDAALAVSLASAGEAPDERLQCALHRPVPRVALGRLLGGRASACIDLSDGLFSDLGHIARASGCGAEIHLGRLPTSDQLAALPEMDRWRLQLLGGDDYELCFTIPPQNRSQLAPIAAESELELTVIGEMVAGTDVRCVRPDGTALAVGSGGYDHFRQGRT